MKEQWKSDNFCVPIKFAAVCYNRTINGLITCIDVNLSLNMTRFATSVDLHTLRNY